MIESSVFEIGGTKYRIMSCSISQQLLEPMMMYLSVTKENKEETEKDVAFTDITRLIGSSFSINAGSMKALADDIDAQSQSALSFNGVIIDVDASRMVASAQSIGITAATYDSIMQNTMHCRSFENKTLKEIVNEILKPYTDVKALINPRFTKQIPYIVQYNQNDYDFLRMLAIRFGEWMYNTGEVFVFGELNVADGDKIVELDYPGGCLMSYGMRQNMIPMKLNHLLVNHYKYGSSDAIKIKSITNEAEGKLNGWTEKVYKASCIRFSQMHISALTAGGFDNNKDDEGADDILNYSLKIQVQGQKTELMTVSGSSKLAKLQIGQQFSIIDNAQNISGQNKDIHQSSLMVIGISHNFDHTQEYANSFTAVPAGCQYPSYADADVHAVAFSQRAKVVDNKDEERLGRIRVQFPWQEIQSKKMKTPWLRIAVPYAGASKGQQFVPEIGEEVMVGFEMNNAERPYIIGSFYNGGNGKPDENWAVSKEEDGTANNIKAIRTRNGHTILFNDKGDAGLLEIYDNKNNTYHVTLSADDKKITIYSAGNVEVIAKGDIGVNADGNIGIKSKGNISMEANKEVSIQASKVKVR